MQVRQIFFLTVGLIFLFLPKNAFSQRVTLNQDGEKIVVYPDGSWHFYREPTADSTVITTYTPVPESEVVVPPVQQKKKKRKKQKNLKDKKKKRKKGKNKSSSKVDVAYELSEKRKAVQRAERAAAVEESTRLAEEEAVFKRIFLEDELEDAYHSIDMTHEDIGNIEVRLKRAREGEEAAKEAYKSAQASSRTYEKMIDFSSKKRNKLLAKMDDDIDVPADDYSEPSEDWAAVSETTYAPVDDFQQNTYEASTNMQRPPIRVYDPKTNVLRFPPNRPCELAYDDVDEFSGKKRKQTQKTLFFTHTPERFRSYFKGRDYLTCSGTLISVDGTIRSINIEYTIATDQAAREFGVLEKGSQFILRLIDGGKIILVNNKTATGIIDPVSKTTTYNTTYPLNKGQLRRVREAEVDKVRMIWATGYEDYEVYQVDFFRDLFRCLEE